MAVSARKRTEQEGPGELPVVRVVREIIEELRKVVWPTPAELYRYTLVVLVTVVVLSVFIGTVDYVVGEFVKRFVYAGVVKS